MSGRVTHSQGVVNGITENGENVHLISGSNIDQKLFRIADKVEKTEVNEVGTIRNILLWLIKFSYIASRIINRSPKDAVVLYRYGVTTSLVAKTLRMITRKRKWVVEVNSLAIHKKKMPPLLKKLVLMFEKWSIKGVDYIYVVSEGLKEDLVKGRRTEKDNIIVIPNASDRNYSHKIMSSDDAELVKFVYMGVFQQYYDMELLLKSFLALGVEKNIAQLHLYGDGPQFNKISALAEGHDNIVIHGRYNLEEIIENGSIDKSCILVLPYGDNSLARIGSPIKMFEYMAIGLPIITSDVGQLKQIYRNEENALIYHAGEQEELTNCMRKILSDKKLGERLAKNIKNDYQNKHNWKERMKKLLGEIR